jgi:dUTP pyrophosphatase
MSLLVQKLSDSALLPTRGSEKSAGLDLYSPVSGVIQPRQRLLVPLDISIQLPKGTYGHVLPRSGLAVKNGIHVGAGVIDQDYRGNVGVLLFNISDTEFSFKAGDRIAQLVIKSYEHVIVEEVSFVDDTERGQKGYGSSGL